MEWMLEGSGFWESDHGWVRRLAAGCYHAGLYFNDGREYGPFARREDAQRWVEASQRALVAAPHA
jgi:hypothetical protein